MFRSCACPTWLTSLGEGGRALVGIVRGQHLVNDWPLDVKPLGGWPGRRLGDDPLGGLHAKRSVRCNLVG